MPKPRVYDLYLLSPVVCVKVVTCVVERDLIMMACVAWSVKCWDTALDGFAIEYYISGVMYSISQTNSPVEALHISRGV